MSNYDDGRQPSVPVGPGQLPEPDPRVAGGFGKPPVRETIPVERHPAGDDQGRGGRFR